jgi:septation ring formation regulator EzrA
MDKNKVIEKVKEQILDAEKTGDYSKIDFSLCKKRLDWLEEHIDDVKEKSIAKKAYILLLIKKMEIDASEIPIVYEDEKKIVWRSFNWCPVLEACKELGIDSRKVCKNGYENSVTKFV